MKCNRTGKTIFRDNISALLFISKKARQDARVEKDLKRAYKCSYCRKWHLTSKSYNQGETTGDEQNRPTV